MSKDVLIVEDDSLCRELLEQVCSKKGYSCKSIDNGDKAIAILKKESFRLIMTDIKLPGAQGPEILKKTKELYPDTDVVILTAFGSIEQAVECIKRGAYDYLTKPCEPERLELIVQRIFEKQNLMREAERLRGRLEESFRFKNIIGKSKQMQEVFDLIRIAADSDVTVLITGDSGTGKELVANSIHYNSLRKRAPFVKVTCPAIPEGLIESELFGHEKGAFTSAINKRIGKFEEAQAGTIFLDEIADLPLHTQTKLLQFLEDHTLERVGSNKRIKINTRVITATNRNITGMITTNEFREDLYWRLNVLGIEIPPLRDRKEDIPCLIEHFLRRNVKSQMPVTSMISPGAMAMLLDYNWPGNVRELLHALERASLLAQGKRIEVQHLPTQLISSSSTQNCSFAQGGTLEAIIKKEIVRTLEKYGWNKTRAARELGIDRTSLIRKLKKYGIGSSGSDAVNQNLPAV